MRLTGLLGHLLFVWSLVCVFVCGFIYICFARGSLCEKLHFATLLIAFCLVGICTWGLGAAFMRSERHCGLQNNLIAGLIARMRSPCVCAACFVSTGGVSLASASTSALTSTCSQTCAQRQQQLGIPSGATGVRMTRVTTTAGPGRLGSSRARAVAGRASMGTSSRAGTGVLCAWYTYCDLGANAGMMQRSVHSRRSSSSSSPVLLAACMCRSKFGLRRSVGAEESVPASSSVLCPRLCALSTVIVRCAAVSTRCAGLVVLAAVLGCLCLWGSSDSVTGRTRSYAATNPWQGGL